MSAQYRPESPGTGYRLLQLPLYLFWIVHGVKHGLTYRLSNYLSMRLFGFHSAAANQVWVHASSVGEVRAVTPLVRALLERGEKVLFTSFTASGYQAIRRDLGDSVSSGVIPPENGWQCARFFFRHSIKLGLVMETELWPELLFQARKRGIKLLLVNARLSRKSLDAGNYIRRLLASTLGYFDLILTRSERDRDALLSLGASAQRIRIIGNLKSLIEAAQQYERLIERDYLLLASSHAGEEQQFLETRPAELEGILLVIAPRHPDRGASIRTQIERLGLRCSVRSKAQPLDPGTEVYLADTLGELKPLLAHASIVVMGGSFDSTGGHNLIEAASLGRAIITGPSDANIAEDIELLGPGSGVLQVADMVDCWRAIAELRAHPARVEALGREARSRLAQQPDIVQQYLAAIEPYLRQQPNSP
ncbi:MAG: hypothetical protein OEN02_03965 [Gammaproteobacteria bacterium]|nr:hypothetical protein [Gammaproteobacteria bacterium]MDH3534656.1 hypothetical protein [Gammaproteobacteria bacterium]